MTDAQTIERPDAGTDLAIIGGAVTAGALIGKRSEVRRYSVRETTNG